MTLNLPSLLRTVFHPSTEEPRLPSRGSVQYAELLHLHGECEPTDCPYCEMGLSPGVLEEHRASRA